MSNNISANFVLKGRNSILIGLYLIAGSYFLKSILDGYLNEDTTLIKLSKENIAFYGIAMLCIVFLLASITLFFSGKRVAIKNKTNLWNASSKKVMYIYFIGFTILIIAGIILLSLGFIDYITPTLLFIYSVVLFLLKNKSTKNLLILSGLSILLALICVLIPSYWYSSITILGIAHITYGVMANA